MRLKSCLLLCQLRPKSFFSVGYVSLVARRIDKRIQASFFEPREFRLQVEVITVRTQKHVDRQRLEDSESAFVVGLDVRIRRVR